MNNGNGSKIWIWVIVILIIIGGVWWYLSSSSSSTPSTTPTQQTNTTSVTGANPNDDSDAAMAQDATAIDTQMSGLNSDNASADQGLASQ